MDRHFLFYYSEERMEKKVKALSIVLAGLFLLPMPTNAMHIMEGFLEPVWCITWGVLALPFVVFGLFSIKKSVEGSSRKMLILAMCGAFAFVLSALKLPSVTGSSSHPTGVGLGAILFGPLPMAVIGTIVLLFQALLLAHGGLTTLGANIFSMAIVGPFVSFGIYLLFKKIKLNKSVCVFAAAFIGNMATYIVTSLQLGVAFPDPAGGIMASVLKFMGIFALTQIPVAVSEGLLTVVVFSLMEKYAKNEVSSMLKERQAKV